MYWAPLQFIKTSFRFYFNLLYLECILLFNDLV